MQLLQNKKIGLHFEVKEKIEAGIKLSGIEVKSLKNKQGSLDGGRVLVRGGEAFLIGVFIPPYQQNNTPKDYDPYQNRKLLLNKKEIAELAKEEEIKTLTAIPVSLYLKKNLIKCEVALCKKKQAGDKRENIKKDIARREIRNS